MEHRSTFEATDLLPGRVGCSWETAKTVWRTDGPAGFVRFGLPYLYNALVRPRLPATAGQSVVRYDGVAVRDDRHWFDTVVPFAGNRPAYERSLLRGIRGTVSPGDAVVVVGGGYGVSTVVAARAASPDGRVRAYEGAAGWVDVVRDTVRLNGVEDAVSVVHAAVTDRGRLRGERGDARTVDPGDLPPADVLVLDCEGAEARILERMAIRPDRVVVETHGGLGSPTSTVTGILADRGYHVADKRPAHDNPYSADQFVVEAHTPRE